jgi:hypothetical protein
VILFMVTIAIYVAVSPGRARAAAGPPRAEFRAATLGVIPVLASSAW